MGETGQRVQKVYYGRYNRKNRGYLPMIRISGKFLKTFNFNVGDFIEIKILNGEINIKKIVSDKPP